MRKSNWKKLEKVTGKDQKKTFYLCEFINTKHNQITTAMLKTNVLKQISDFIGVTDA